MGSDEEPVWMTAYAAPAFAGEPLPPPLNLCRPIPQLSRRPAPVPLQVAVASTAASGSGGGVIAGGGGDGAPLFSRPQPQSVGHTPGGARQLQAARRHDDRKTSRRLREPDSGATADALTIEASSAEERSAPNQRQPTTPPSSTSRTDVALGDRQLVEWVGRSRHGRRHQCLRRHAHRSNPALPACAAPAADENSARWMAIAFAGLIVALILVGSLFERRRREVIL